MNIDKFKAYCHVKKLVKWNPFSDIDAMSKNKDYKSSFENTAMSRIYRLIQYMFFNPFSQTYVHVIAHKHITIWSRYIKVIFLSNFSEIIK